MKTNYVLLNNVEHADLKVLPHFSNTLGDGAAVVRTFPTEFENIQREYPILLRKDAQSGDFYAVAILGLQKGENLFLDGDEQSVNGWAGNYVPAMVARGPFIIGFQESRDGDIQQPMIYVDEQSPKLSRDEGTPLFLEFGGNSAYLEYVSGVLRTIHQGEDVGRRMFAALNEVGLLEPVSINVDLKNGDKHQLSGYYTVSEDRLNTMSGESLEALNGAGYLRGAFLMLSSLGNIEHLVARKNACL
ncbi:SapC family protein [Microbulbifer agarilyticus]|uniref:SapC family protein n=1 Tax=Microbulbifer agarilyticus TaxID=260552 RepID=UPI001CD7AE5E|nr:SapC family protein [Microbulbifer agarilyticus]MCA0902049.1 SapC family protein [Microbulbifer agarilyticus]